MRGLTSLLLLLAVHSGIGAICLPSPTLRAVPALPMVRQHARKTVCKLEMKAKVKPGPAESLAVTPASGVAPWLTASLPVLTLCCTIAAVCSLDRVVMSVTILPMGEQYGYTDSTRGLIASAFSFGYFLGLGPAGLASSASSPKVVLGAGLILWSIAQAATPAAADIGLTPLLAARALMGLGEAAAIPSLQVIAANFVPASSRSKFWGVLTASLSMGTIAAYSITPPMVANLGWPTAFEIFGAAGLAVALLWAGLGAGSPADLPGYPSGTGPRATASRGGARVDAAGKQGLEGRAALDDVPWGEMASSRPVWALCAAHASSNFFLYFALSWLPTYFAYQFGLSTADAASAAQLPFAAAAVASLCAGAACDALVDREVLRLTTARKLMQGIACLGPAACVLALAAGGAPSRDAAEDIFICALFCQACSSAGFGCAAQDISQRYAALLYGATSAVAVISGAFGQYFTGAILDATGRDFTYIFALTAVVEVLGFFAFMAWWNSDRAFE